MKKPSVVQNLVDSVLVITCLVFFSYILCNAFLIVIREIFIPAIALFSYDLHRYLEQIEHDVMYDGVQEILALTIWRASAIPALFLASPLALRMAPFRARHFKRATEGRIDYADGMRMYFRENAMFDAIVATIMTILMCLVFPVGRMMYPVGMVMLTVHPVLVWLFILPLTLLTLPIGTYFAQKRWRAKYMCSMLD